MKPLIDCQSVTGFIHHLFNEKLLNNLDQFLCHSSTNAKGYKITGLFSDDLFFKVERMPEGFMMKDPNTLSMITQLKHPSILAYYDIAYLTTDNPYFNKNTILIVSEYCEFKNIQQYFKFNMDKPDLIKAMIYNIVDGFAYLHHNNILHGDVNHLNILIKRTTLGFQPKISDLSIICPMNNKSLRVSPEYLAPEVKSFDLYTTESEIWAIGIMIYYLLVRKFPFRSRFDNADVAEVLEFVRNNELEISLPDLGSSYYELIYR